MGGMRTMVGLAAAGSDKRAADTTAPASSNRRHDLDALRAFAMLLGIGLHAALAFAPVPWIAMNAETSGALTPFIEVVHGFRLPLFFLMSGFFAAMLLERRGVRGFLSHRWKRIGLPLLLGMVTVVPAMWGVIIGGHVVRSVVPAPERDWTAAEADLAGIWEAAESGDLDAVSAMVEAGAGVNEPDPVRFTLPLAWAATGDHAEVVAVLLKAGADPNAVMGDGSTPLHTACFFGAAESAKLLLDAGAETGIRNNYGDTPPEAMAHDRGAVAYIADLLGVEADFERVEAGRAEIAAVLAAWGDGETAGAASDDRLAGLVDWSLRGELFMHLWFLWHLCWLAGGLALVVWAGRWLMGRWIGRRLGVTGVPRVLIATPLCLVWLVPLTAVTQGWQAGFGADTSASLVPAPHVLAHYGVFFGFGALVFAARGAADRLGRAWPIWLAVSAAACVVALKLTHDPGAFAERGLDAAIGTRLAPAMQAVFVWTASLGLMGVARRVLSRPSARVRFVSDSSYWLYVAHLPLVVAGQFALAYVSLPPLVEFALLTVVVTAVLLASYRWWVRYRWIGRLLNGARVRPGVDGSVAGGRVAMGGSSMPA